MRKRRHLPAFNTTTVLALLFGMFAPDAGASLRLMGALDLQGYGYQDARGEDHLWMMPHLRVSTYASSIPLSAHFSGGYIGDNLDEFSASGEGRFLKGYLRYGGMTDKTSVRMGRFFLYRGVALGVIDGIDVRHRLNRRLDLSLFTGMLGGLSREFSLDNPKEAFSAGGELKYIPGRCLVLTNTVLALSYTYQTRDKLKLRHRFGFSGSGRFNRAWRVNVYAQMHSDPVSLHKGLARLRYTANDWIGLGEFGLFTPDYADYSWFKDFEVVSLMRARLYVQKWFVSRRWAGGLEFTGLLRPDSNGFLLGPTVTSPYGQAGYRLSTGDRAQTAGPWINLQYEIASGVDLFARWSSLTYEWEQFDIASEELTAVNVGGEYTPHFRQDLTVSLEYQIYRSPQFNHDRRLLGGLLWRFDNRSDK